MYIESKYKSDNKLILFQQTVENHKSICIELGILDKYTAALKVKKNVGGDSNEAALNHFLSRYFNSAARTQLVANCIDDNLEEISQDIIAHFLDGCLYIVDIAAGHGAGIISIINNICRLRELGEFPLDKLKVVIHAIDFSETSLELYSKIIQLNKLKYLSLGIEVDFNSHLLNLSVDEDLSQKIDSIKKSAANNQRYFLICSAISGVGHDFFKNNFIKSYIVITKEFSTKNSDFLWVEPAVRGGWVSEEVDDIREGLIDSSGNELPEVVKVKVQFEWIDPYMNNCVPSKSEFYKINLSNE